MQQAYGSWASPISAATVAAQGLRLSGVALDGDDIYWIEGRPHEGGRSVLVRRTPDGHVSDAVPQGYNVRTRVHEYGGGACVISNGVAYFSNDADQRLYRVDIRSGQTDPIAMTPAGRWCFADAVVDTRRARLICVREDHTNPDAEPVNALVRIPITESGTHAGDVIASGYDFYSTPRLSHDGTRLCWISWRHPNMPWDGTELWIADVIADGSLENARCIAGGVDESIYQPGWGADAALYFASDRDGWWRLYRFTSAIEPVLPDPPPRTEFGRPQWVFGTATWVMPTATRIVTSLTRDGRWRLATIDVAAAVLTEVQSDIEPLEWLEATETHAILVAASPTAADAVVRIGLADGTAEVLRSSSQPDHEGPAVDPGLVPAWVSIPEAFAFATRDGHEAHAFYYPPRNPQFEALPGERPPLIVIGHGGPTTATRDTFDLRVQYWTTRGFAVADVNYGGSSGYGREYRQRLNGQWGVIDVADMIDAALSLASARKADPERLIVRGASAGGYTTLAALTFHPDVFQAGASYYGICDLEVLAHDTHKFESRYLDSLIGPYPAMRDVYRDRSPIHFVDRLACALILFQGLDDKVVPPNQSAMMADAVRAKGLPVAYLTFDGEQHGFRRAETIVTCLEAELSFYCEHL
jgi:dipeptidyl aminopeptidase/acylaminoacyl peptidase